jgi:hypothetical protein
MSQLAMDLTHASHTLPQPLQGHPYLDINDAQQSQTADNMSLPSITTHGITPVSPTSVTHNLHEQNATTCTVAQLRLSSNTEYTN